MEVFVKVERWLHEWVPGVLAWPLGWVFSVLVLVLAICALPPARFKRWADHVNAPSEEPRHHE